MIFFDTNILVDAQNGIPQAHKIIMTCEKIAVSVAVKVEFMVGIKSPEMQLYAQDFLSQFRIIEWTPQIQEQTIRVRRDMRLKLPDAIIYATALMHNAPLYTRNNADFPPNDPLIRVPYSL